MNRTRRDPPWFIAALIALGVGYIGILLILPLVTVFSEGLRRGFSYYLAAITEPDALAAMRLTLLAAGIAVPLNTVFGLAAAWAIAKFEFFGKSALVTLIDIPFSISPVISGLVYVLLYGANGWFGPTLEKLGVQVIFNVSGIVLATTLVTLPFVARELIPLMQSQGADDEAAAATLGAGFWRTLLFVTLPNVKWALMYGVLLCTARAMGEFGAVAVVSGHIRGRTATMPLHVEILYNEYAYVAAFAVASLLALFALVTLAVKTLLEARFGDDWPNSAGADMPLVISDVSKMYGRFPALKSVSLFAEDGEFLALLGPSGSGKTTLLRVIAGLEVPDAGAIEFRGENLLAKPVRERNIGFVFQHYALFRHMSAAQNIAFGLRAKHRSVRPPESAIKAKVEELLALVQLEGLGVRYPAQLSGGQRQRVALARALAIEPKILLLDEPFGALDAKVRRGLRRWLRDLHERTGLTTIFVTHDQEEALELADRVALLKDGALEQVGTPEELYHEPESAFVFDFLGDSIKLPCVVEGGIAIISGVGVPIIGARPTANAQSIAHVRPDAFTVTVGSGQGIAARVRNVLLAGSDARIECVLDTGDAIEVRIAHEDAGRIAPRDRVTLAPRAVRVWPEANEPE